MDELRLAERRGPSRFNSAHTSRSASKTACHSAGVGSRTRLEHPLHQLLVLRLLLKDGDAFPRWVGQHPVQDQCPLNDSKRCGRFCANCIQCPSFAWPTNSRNMRWCEVAGVVRKGARVHAAERSIDAGDRGHHAFVSFEVCPRTLRAEPCDRRVHESGIGSLQRLITQPQPIRDIRAENLDQHIGNRTYSMLSCVLRSAPALRLPRP
jgi:hypothetical protein